MTRLQGLCVVAALASTLSACAQTARRSANPALAGEERAVAPLKSKYKDVIMGTDVEDRTLIVYVDVDNLYSMDEDAEDAMKAYALSRWKTAWKDAHPHEHGTLRLSVRDYYGKEIYARSTSV